MVTFHWQWEEAYVTLFTFKNYFESSLFGWCILVFDLCGIFASHIFTNSSRAFYSLSQILQALLRLTFKVALACLLRFQLLLLVFREGPCKTEMRLKQNYGAVVATFLKKKTYFDIRGGNGFLSDCSLFENNYR